jgi:hypothetical protein
MRHRAKGNAVGAPGALLWVASTVSENPPIENCLIQFRILLIVIGKLALAVRELTIFFTAETTTQTIPAQGNNPLGHCMSFLGITPNRLSQNGTANKLSKSASIAVI